MPLSCRGRALILVALVGCADQSFGPGSQDPVALEVRVTLPATTPAAWAPIGETLHVAVRRAGRTEPVVDTSLVIASALAMTFEVPLAQAVERFVASAEVRYGGALFFLAFDVVQLSAGRDTSVTLAAQYVGPGARAASYTLAARDSSLLAGDTASLVPQVLDSLGQLIPGVPVRYVTSRPTLVTVDTAGVLSALPGVFDTARIAGFLPMGLSSELVVSVVSGSASTPRRRTWVGGTPASETNWFTASNWSPVGEPGTGDTIVIEDTNSDPVLVGKDTVTALQIASGVLTMGRGTLVVLGDLATEGGSAGGALAMTHPDDTVRVIGGARFAGRVAEGMTDGVLIVGGDLDIPDQGGTIGFAASGAHRTMLNGALPQRLAVGGGNAGARFQHLEIANSAGSVLIGGEQQVSVDGVLRVSTATTIDNGSGGNGDVTLEVGDSLVMVAGSRLTVFELGLSGPMAVAGAFAPQEGGAFRVRFSGAAQRIQAGLDYRDVEIDGDALLTGATTFTGNLNVFGSLDLAGHALVVTGDLHTENGDGRLIMQRPADRLEVRGDATFEGDSIAGDLTEGILRVAGDFRQLRYSNKRMLFRASGNHRTILDGSTPQQVQLADATTFGHLEIANTSGTVGIGARRIVTTRTLRVSTAVLITETGSEPDLTMDVGDTLTISVDATLSVGRLVARGPLAVGGTLDVVQIEFAGLDQVIPSQIPYRSFTVSGRARLAGRTTALNYVNVYGSQAALTLAGHTLESAYFSTGSGLAGAVDTSSLVMQQPNDSLIVNGDAVFGSIATAGSLSAGVLAIRSDIGGGLFQHTTPLAFQPTGSHRTVLAGSAVQGLLEHAGSGVGASFFRHLTLRDSAQVYLRGSVAVTGTLSGTLSGTPSGGGARVPPVVMPANATPTSIDAGGADIAGLTLRGVTLAVGSGLVRLDSVRFEQQDPTATQLRIVHPGAATAYTLTGNRFVTTPTSGAYVSATDAAPTDGQTLTINMAASEPADGSARTLTAGGAVVNWVVPAVPLSFVQVSAGFRHSCGLVSSGAAYCWGVGNVTVNAFGDGTSGGRATPGPVSGGLTFTTISAGDSHSCGLTPSGTAYCWGRNVRGSIGDGTLTDRPTPVAVVGGLQFVALEAGGHTTCALTAAGAAYCWGRNNYGEIGDGSLSDRLVPTLVSGGLTFARISVSVDSRVCALTAAGAAYCWGHNSEGGVGDNSTTDRRTPVPVAGGLAFSALSTRGYDHACAITTGAQSYCWGRNADGELGDGTTTRRLTPAAVAGGHAFVSLETGTYLSCALTGSGAAYCWGGNNGGQLGDGTLTGRTVPTPVTGGLTFTALRAGAGFVVATVTGGAAYGWGLEYSNGRTANSAVPVPLGPPVPPP